MRRRNVLRNIFPVVKPQTSDMESKNLEHEI